MMAQNKELVVSLEGQLRSLLHENGEASKACRRIVPLSSEFELRLDSLDECWHENDELQVRQAQRLFLFQGKDDIQKDLHQIFSSRTIEKTTLFVFLHTLLNGKESASGYCGGLPPELCLLQPSNLEDFTLFSLMTQLAKQAPQGRFSLRKEEWERKNMPVSIFKEFADGFVKKGAICTSSNLEIGSEIVGQFSAFSNEFSGDLDSVIISDETPLLSASVVQEGIEYVYERTSQGRTEVRQHVADAFKRFSTLRSFTVKYDNAQKQAFAYDIREVEEIETAERSMGLYEPDAENTKIFFDSIEQIKTELGAN